MCHNHVSLLTPAFSSGLYNNKISTLVFEVICYLFLEQNVNSATVDERCVSFHQFL